MPARDAAQLILEVDARIATAQRSVNQLARAIQQDAAGMDGSLKKIEQSGERVANSLGGISGRTRAGFTQLSFQIGDVSQQMAMGTRASTIWAQQSGQVIQALQIMGGEGNKFLQFLGGPWGIAISTAAVLLGTLAPKLLENRDEVGKLVDKMRQQARQAELNKAADEQWKNTVEGLTEAIRKRRAEQEKALQTDIQAEDQSLQSARGELANLIRQRARLQKEIRDTIEQYVLKPDGKGGIIPGNIIEEPERKVLNLQRKIAALNAQIKGAEANIRGAQVPIAERNVEERLDKVKAATDTYTRALGKLRRELRGGAIDQAKFEAALATATAKRDRDIKAANEDKKGADADLTRFASPVAGGTPTGKFGEQRPGHTHAGIDIAVPVGTPVQAAAAGTVIESGTLPGYGNVIIIDHGRGTITRYAHLSKLSAAKGDVVSQGQAVGLSGGAKGAEGSGNSTGPHLHYEVRRGGSPVDPRKGSFPTDPALAGQGAVRSAETEAQKALSQQNAFAEESARLDQELLQAKNALIRGIDAQAEAAIAALKGEQERRKLGYDNDAKEGKISQANAEILKAKVDQVALEKIRAVETQRSIETLRRASDLEQRRFQYLTDDLRFADEMATTQAERRRLQLQILDAVYEQKRLQLETNKQIAKKNKDFEEAASIQGQIDRLPTQKFQDQKRVEQGTMSPFEEWAKQVPKTAAEIGVALQSIEVQGLDRLASSLTDVIMGTKSLGAAFKDVAREIIAQIIEMTIRMLIFKAVSAAMSAFGGGGGGISDPFAGGGGLGGVPVDTGSTNFITGAPGFASGGSMVIGGNGGTDTNLLSLNGSPIARVSRGETLSIVPRTPRINVGRASGAGRGGALEVRVLVDASDDLMVKAAVVADSRIRAHEPRIVQNARSATIKTLTRPRLIGRP